MVAGEALLRNIARLGSGDKAVGVDLEQEALLRDVPPQKNPSSSKGTRARSRR